MKIFPLFLSTEKEEFEKYTGEKINTNEYNNLINTVTSLTDNIRNNPNIFKNIENKNIENSTSSSRIDNIVSEIDKYINSFSLDELLNKPSFFLERSQQLWERDILFNLTDNNLDGVIMDASIDGRNVFNQKKIFYNLLTDFIASEKIYTDDKQDTIFLFQYLVNTFFNTFIKLYNDKKKYSDTDLFFLYKGGTVMQILYKKYIDLFDNPDFLRAYDANFKRSDSDYSIFINNQTFNNEKQYNKIFYDMNILTYNILGKIKNILTDNKIGKYILPLTTITSDELSSKLNKVNETLSTKREDLDLFNDVDKFIGLTLNDITYMNESIPEKFLIHRLEDKNGNEDTVNTSKKEAMFYTNKKVSVNRQGFFVSTIKDPGPKTKIINIDDQASNIDSNGIYNYFNQTNRFSRSGSSHDFNDFTLHRMKINCILYYKTKAAKTNGVKYGFFNCPGELIDVPIAKIDDYKVEKQSTHVHKYYKNYLNENKIYSKNLIFKSYSLEGFIDDLLLTFTEVDLPWQLDKYNKKLIRLTLLVLLLLYNEYNKDYRVNLIDFCEKYIAYLSDTRNDYNHLLNYKINTKKELKKDELVKLYIDYFCELKKQIKNTKDKDEYDKMTKTIKDIFDKFILYLKSFKGQGNIISDYDKDNEKVPYLKKYLKYKKKYLKLRTNI
jgi:hypothetical protein